MDEKVAKTPRPHMLDADEVAELLRIKKGSAYEVIRQMNKEQEALTEQAQQAVLEGGEAPEPSFTAGQFLRV